MKNTIFEMIIEKVKDIPDRILYREISKPSWSKHKRGIDRARNKTRLKLFWVSTHAGFMLHFQTHIR